MTQQRAGVLALQAEWVEGGTREGKKNVQEELDNDPPLSHSSTPVGGGGELRLASWLIFYWSTHHVFWSFTKYEFVVNVFLCIFNI